MDICFVTLSQQERVSKTEEKRVNDHQRDDICNKKRNHVYRFQTIFYKRIGGGSYAMLNKLRVERMARVSTLARPPKFLKISPTVQINYLRVSLDNHGPKIPSSA